MWQKIFDKMSDYLNKRFDPDWKERDGFFEDFEEKLKQSETDHFH